MDKYILYHDMLEALAHDQCPVCRLVDARMDRLIKVLLREGAGDSRMIDGYVRAKGYCNTHAWRVKESGDPASQSAFYRALLERHRASLERYLSHRRPAVGAIRFSDSRATEPLRKIRELIQSRTNLRGRQEETREFLDSFASEERCPLCVAAESSERRYVEAIPEYFEGDEEFRERYRNRGVLCHPHVRRLVAEHANRDSVPELLDIQLSRLDLQIEHLRELEHRSSARFSEEEGGAYLGGWIRAVRLDVGSPGTDTRYKQRAAPMPNATIKP